MNILFVSTNPLDRDGISNVILSMYKGLYKYKKYNLFLLFPSIKDSSLLKEIPNHEDSLIFLKIKKTNIVRYPIGLMKVLRLKKIDLVYFHASSCLIAVELLVAALARIKYRFVHSHSTSTKFPFLNILLRPLFNTLYTNAFACGEEAGKWMFQGHPYIVINNGIDLKKYVYTEELRKNTRDILNIGDEIVLGNVANFVRAKNHKFILDVFANLPCRSSYKLLFVGSGPLMKESQVYVKELGIENQVIFIGKVKDVVPYLCAMDLFVLPSLYEGFPLSLVESQATGLMTIVSSNVTSSVNITGSVHFLPITQETVWVKEIERLSISIKDRSSDNYKKLLKTAGYDLNDNIHILVNEISKLEIINNN